jgi:hypothetical protein
MKHQHLSQSALDIGEAVILYVLVRLLFFKFLFIYVRGDVVICKMSGFLVLTILILGKESAPSIGALSLLVPHS